METCLNNNSNLRHTITIEGKPISLYVNSDKETLTDYLYLNCVSVNIIETVDCSNETSRIPNLDGSICDPYNIIIHTSYNEDNQSVIYNPDVTKYTFESDGWYRFTHFIIPTKEYYVNLGFDGLIDVDTLKDNLIERFGDCELPERIVVFDTEKYCFLLGELLKYQILVTEDEDSYYEYETHYEWKEITFLDVVCILKSNFSSTIQCYSNDILNYSHLEETYLRKINDLLKVYLSELCTLNCNNFTKNNLSDIQLRDYYWMALNAVKYAVELGNYCKALTLLNCVSQCNNNSDDDLYCILLNSENGCGCS